MVLSVKNVTLVALLFGVPAQGVFIVGERFQNRHGNTIECFSDYHMPCSDSSVADIQQQEIIEKAAEYNSHVIVEDMNARYKEMEKKYVRAIDTTAFEIPLDDLSLACEDANISCTNVEFRHASSASLGGVPIPACDTLDAFKQVLKEINQYNDGSLLNAYYWKTIADVCGNNKTLIDALHCTECSLYDYCQGKCGQIQKTVTLFDAPLLDARIMHEVYENRLKSSMFICAGANHIKRIRPLLRKLGYKSMGSIQQDVVLQPSDKTDQVIIDSSCALSIENYFNFFDTQDPYIPMAANSYRFA